MRKTFEIKDKAILEHLSKQPNQTRYIIDLIRKDMQGQETLTKEMVIQIIKEYLRDYKSVDAAKDEQIEHSVKNILGMFGQK